MMLHTLSVYEMEELAQGLNPTDRKFAVVIVRAEDATRPEGTYVAFAEVLKTTDSIVTAGKEAAKVVPFWGTAGTVIELATGEEI